MFEDFDYDYNNILEDVDDLYEDNDEYDNEKEWDNYYHNIADELVDD